MEKTKIRIALAAGLAVTSVLFFLVGGICLEVYLVLKSLWLLAGVWGFIWLTIMFALNFYSEMETKRR